MLRGYSDLLPKGAKDKDGKPINYVNLGKGASATYVAPESGHMYSSGTTPLRTAEERSSAPTATSDVTPVVP